MLFRSILDSLLYLEILKREDKGKSFSDKELIEIIAELKNISEYEAWVFCINNTIEWQKKIDKAGTGYQEKHYTNKE